MVYFVASLRLLGLSTYVRCPLVFPSAVCVRRSLKQTSAQRVTFFCKSEIVLLHVVKACRAEEVQLHPFLTSAMEAVFGAWGSVVVKALRY